MEVGGERYLSLHCHHQNDFCIKVGSDQSHFNVSLIVRDKVTRSCPQTTTFEEKGEPKRYRTEVLPLTSLPPYRQAKPALWAQTRSLSTVIGLWSIPQPHCPTFAWKNEIRFVTFWYNKECLHILFYFWSEQYASSDIVLPNARYVVGVCLDPNAKRFKRTLIYYDTDTQ